jgi:hypothetical protein
MIEGSRVTAPWWLRKTRARRERGWGRSWGDRLLHHNLRNSLRQHQNLKVAVQKVRKIVSFSEWIRFIIYWVGVSNCYELSLITLKQRIVHQNANIRVLSSSSMINRVYYHHHDIHFQVLRTLETQCHRHTQYQSQESCQLPNGDCVGSERVY